MYDDTEISNYFTREEKGDENENEAEEDATGEVC